MILDNLLLLSGSVSAAGVLAGQAVNGAGNVLSTNTVDLGPAATGGNQVGDLGAGESLRITIGVVTAPTVGTSVQFQLVQADDEALSSNLQVLGQTDAIPIANLTIGAIVPLNVDRAAPYAPKRYIGVRYVNVGAIATASYTAGIVKDQQDVRSLYYRSGYSVA